MRKSSVAAGAMMALFSAAVLIASLSMEYYSSIGPGPGFFSFWLSLILGLLSLIWIFQELRKARDDGQKTRIFPRGKDLVRELSVLASLIVMTVLMEILGFQIAMFAFLMYLLLGIGKAGKVTSLIIALVGSVGFFYVFTGWLDVQLPKSSLDFLAAIGF